MDQMDLFSQADEHLEKTMQALLETDFSAARKELQNARSINPFLPNLDATLHMIDFFQKFHKKAKNTAEALAALFDAIPEAVAKGTLLLREAELIEDTMAKMALQNVKMSKPFLDAGKHLHWGYCHLLNRQFGKAEKAFKETLNQPKEQRADLWGYYGDLCHVQNDQRQAQSAYIRALLLDPQELDMYRLRHNGLKQLYRDLLQDKKEPEARSLLLFEAWHKELFTFINTGRSTDSQPEGLQALLKKPLPKDKPGKWHRFSIHFYIDQMNAKVDVNNRESMQKIDAELFQRYLEILKERSQS
jgi:tetratricopeptide (TPR) repeat protein